MNRRSSTIVSTAPAPGYALLEAAFFARALCVRFLALTAVFAFFATGLRAGEPTSTTPAAVDLSELSIEELIALKVNTVYGASRHWQDVRQAPSSVSIVTAEDVKLYGYRTLADALRSAPGIYLNYDRNYTYLGIRGFNRPGDVNTRTLVLIDGHRMNDNFQDSALIGHEFMLDVDLIDRVEIIRGPGASVYGNNAFFGVINILTRSGRQLDGFEVSGEAGSFDTYYGRVSYGKKFDNGLEMLLSGSYYDSQGPGKLFYKEYESTPSQGVAENVDSESFASAFARVSWNDFTLEGGYRSREKQIPTGAYETVFNSSRNQTLDQRGYADLKFQRDLPGDWNVSARGYYDYAGQTGDYLTDFAAAPPPQLVLNVDKLDGQRAGLDVQASKRFLDRHTITAGAEFRDNFHQHLVNYNVEPRTTYLDDLQRSWNIGVFAQAEIALLTNLTLNAGLRLDDSKWFDAQLNPRVALIWSPVPRTTLKGIYGGSYRDPTLYETFYGDGGLTAKGNADLKSETIRTWQMVWEQDWGVGWRSSGTIFYYQIDDLISYATDPADGLLHYVNASNLDATGVELSLEKRWVFGLRARASYTWQNANDTDGDRWLDNSPRHLAKLNLDAPLYRDKIFAGLELLYQSDARTLRGETAGDFAILNLTLFSQRLIKNLEFSASLYNLLDTRYSFPASGEHLQDVIEQDGRTFRVKLTYRF